MLWALWHDRSQQEAPPKAGLVSTEMTDTLPHAYYYAAGYRPSGTRAVRIDMLERLAGLIRTARTEADMREGFEATPQMMSLVGCSGEDFEGILRSLNLRKNVIKRKPAPQALDTKANDTSPELADTQVNVVTPDSNAPVEDNSAAADDATSQTQETMPEPLQSEVTQEDKTPAGETENADQTNNSKSSLEQAQPDAQDATPANSEQEAEVEIALWRPAPRKQHRPNKSQEKTSHSRNQGKHNARAKGGKKHADGRPGANSKQSQRRPPRQKKADPNSPFAVLAALKSELSAPKKADKEKDKEQTE